MSLLIIFTFKFDWKDIVMIIRIVNNSFYEKYVLLFFFVDLIHFI